MAAADWSSLPIDLIQKIANELPPAVEDFAVLTAVCRSFRYALDKKLWRSEGSSRPPWLLLCCQGDDDANPPPNSSKRGFLNLYKNKRRFVMDLPEIHGRRCWGSPYGWIVTLGLDQQLHMFNPLNRRRILLPQTICEMEESFWANNDDEKSPWMRQNHIDRSILIKRPPSSYSSSRFDDFLIVTIMNYEVRVVRPHSWEPVKFFFKDGTSATFVYDVASYNGKIYLLGIHGQLLVCSNFDGPDPPTAHEYGDNQLFEGTEKLYLLESLGELVMVVRYFEYDEEEDDHDHEDEDEDAKPYYRTEGFEVYQFDHDSKEWVELEDLGDCAIFVGDCQSISLPQPEKFGCRRNCIYFTDDNYEQFRYKGGHDMGICDYDKMTIDPLYDGVDSLSTYSTPTWLIPSFN